MFHLPKTHNEKHNGLQRRPVENSAVGALARLSESLLAVSLVILFLSDLFHLVEQLTDSQLQLGELLLLGYICVIDGVLADLNVEVDSELGATEPGGGIRVHTDDVFAGRMTGEGDTS